MARVIQEGQSEGQERKKFHEMFPGPQPAWIVGLIDMGTIDDEFNGKITRKTHVRLDLEFPMCKWVDQDNNQHNWHLGIDINLTWGSFEANGAPKGNCIWRDLITRLNYGRLPNSEERKLFDYERFLLGKAVMADTKPSSNGKYTDISAISLPPPGYTFPNPETQLWLFNFEQFFIPALLEEKRLSEYHIKRIKNSFEWQRMMSTSAPVHQPNHPAPAAPFPQQPQQSQQPQFPLPSQPVANPYVAGPSTGTATYPPQPASGDAPFPPQTPTAPSQPAPIQNPNFPGNDLPF